MENSNRARTVWIIVGVVVVIAIGIVIALSMNKGSSSSSSTVQSAAQTVQTASSTSPSTSSNATYTSADDGFSVAFPGTPQITTSTYNSPSAGPVPLTEYRVTAATTPLPQYYTVYVYHYPSNYTFSSDYLNTALQSYGKVIADSFPGSTLATQQNTQFQGALALTATVNIPVKGADTNDYVILTTHGQNAYVISSYGVSQSDFNAFITSFGFTD